MGDLLVFNSDLMWNLIDPDIDLPTSWWNLNLDFRPNFNSSIDQVNLESNWTHLWCCMHENSNLIELWNKTYVNNSKSQFFIYIYYIILISAREDLEWWIIYWIAVHNRKSITSGATRFGHFKIWWIMKRRKKTNWIGLVRLERYLITKTK